MRVGAARTCGLAALVAACLGCAVDPSPSVDTTCKKTPPTGPYRLDANAGSVLPDLSLPGIGEGGSGPVRLHADYHVPCAEAAQLLVIRLVGGAWCGTSRWHGQHTTDLLFTPRIRVIDVVTSDAENNPAGTFALEAWRAFVDRPNQIATVLDPELTLRGLFPPSGAPLPLYVIVDARTMVVRGWMSNPDPDTLHHQLASHLAALDGVAPPPPPKVFRWDGLFTRDQWDLIRQITPPGAPPPDPTNAVADDPQAAAFGKALFTDTGLSRTNTVACVTCHDPKKQLSDGLPRALGVGEGDRRTPRIALAAHAPAQLWDGRADTLWAQALGPLEDEHEMGSSRVSVARRIATAHAAAYRAVFPSHALPDVTRLPDHAKPGDAAWLALPPEERDRVNQVFVDVGKALAAYERTFRVPETALDRYARSEFDALTPRQKSGLSLFAEHGCFQCHHGPRLTDDAYHVTRMATGRRDGKADRGRLDGLAALLASEFRADLRWSDRRSTFVAPSTHPRLLGAFKTPSLRGVAEAAPFGHGGTLPTLVEVTELYGQGGLPAGDPRTVGEIEPWLPTFDVTSQWALPPILETLGGAPLAPGL